LKFEINSYICINKQDKQKSMMNNSKMMPQEFVDKLPTLTKREQSYLLMMWGKSGVLYITAKPGVAKSAIARSIAQKMNFRYMDIRLSMVDETDVGLYPNVSDVEGVKCLDFVVPRWAIEANKQPTIIHFEELNRASQSVRNAALQILLERQIGVNFKFNDTVLMMSSGNLGDEDGTDVEEFDSALNNRLIHVKHTLSFPEWVDGFAKDNVHRMVVSYLQAHPENLYKTAEGSQAYATPRSWTFMSDFIVSNFGMDAHPREFLPILREVAAGYVGNSAMKFLQYCEDMLNININDIINDYDRVAGDLKKYNRDKNSELIQSLKEMDLGKFTEKQLTNVTKFLKGVGEDELTAYLLFILDNNLDISKPKIKTFLLGFEDVLRTIKKINKPGK
jgi:hypothetical protein